MSDAAEFEAFVRANAPALLRTAFLLTGTQQGAEELVQDTLARLYPRWARVEAADLPLAYVRRSLTNRLISQRRVVRGIEVPLDLVADRRDPGDVAEAVAARRTVWQLLGQLPPRQRAAIVLREFDDLPDTEIAAMLGCRPASVRSLISRGMASMHEAYVRADPVGQRGSTR